MTLLARLLVIRGPQKGAAFELAQDEVHVGRESANEIEIRDLSVSRKHCVIRAQSSGFLLTSLESTNGTRVNGIRVREHLLADGDEITIGDTTMRFLTMELELLPLPVDPTQFSIEVKTRVALAHSSEGTTADARHLDGLLHLARTLAGSLSVEAIQRLFVGSALAFTAAERAAFVRPDPDLSGKWICCAAHDANGWTSNAFAISSTVLKEVSRERFAILIEEVKAANVISDSLRAAGVRSVIALPVQISGELYGVLYLDSIQQQLNAEHLYWLASAVGMVSVALQNSTHIRALKQENLRLRDESQIRYSFIGDSAPMREIYQRIARIAPSDATVLIFGESGTGKELAARAIHENSPRHSRPFVGVNCALLKEELLESDLFGHEKGAFTGAVQQKKGKLEHAEGGTLFLDELGELSLPIQAKLLRVIQERTFERLGGMRSIAANVRILGATHRNLEEAVSTKTFRHDLYFRLKVVSLTLPPLRDRREDIPALAYHLLGRCAERARRRVTSIDSEAMRLLTCYSWPGNVRELENVLEHALVMGEDSVVRARDLPETLFESEPASSEGGARFYTQLNEAKHRIIREALETAGWNYTQAAAALGINRTYLHRLVRSLGITPPQHSRE